MLGRKKKPANSGFSSTSMAPGHSATTNHRGPAAWRMFVAALQALLLVLAVVIGFLWFMGHNEKGGFEQPDVVTRLIDNHAG